jgi:hypothetical protein
MSGYLRQARLGLPLTAAVLAALALAPAEGHASGSGRGHLQWRHPLDHTSLPSSACGIVPRPFIRSEEGCSGLLMSF